VFWRIHNPTTRNRQGLDFGSQYRSAIFYHDAGQQETAIASRDAHQQSNKRQIVTQITPASAFYPGQGVPPALPRKAWPPRPRSHHPVNRPTGRPHRGRYQSPALTTASTISGASRRISHPSQGPPAAADRADCSLLSRPRGAQAGEHFAEESTSARRLVNGHAEVEFPSFEVEPY
jgi:hypothetical protein